MGSTKRWMAVGAIVILSFVSGLARAAPENGWWWNPNESGRGFFIEIQDTQMYLGGYFYADDGRALWLVSQGQISSPTTYSGRLLTFANGQTLVGDYKPPGAAVDAGAISLVFTDDRHATLTWPGGTVAIERQSFDPGTAKFLPQTGWWWNEAESGRGYSVEVQGNNLFFVGFMYDSAGNPLWYFSAGPLTSPSQYTGQLLQFAGGQTLTGPYRPPGTPKMIGTMTLDFTAPDEAQLTLVDPEALVAPTEHLKKGKSKIFRVRPQFTPKPLGTLPDAWAGEFAQTVKFKVVDVGSVESTVTAVGNVIWEDEFLTTNQASYAPIGGTIELTYKFEIRSALQDCDGSFQGTFPLNPSDGSLTYNTNGKYSGYIRRAISYTPVGICVQVTPVGPITFPLTGTNVADIDITMSGNAIYLRMQGRPTPLTPAATTVTTSWDFSARK